jgi:hypothetical protein
MTDIPERVLQRLRDNQPTKGDKPYYTEDEHGCWIWQLARNGYNYGQLGWSEQGKLRLIGAHRANYIAHRGPYPDNLQIDHLCLVKACVNPLHLEVVTSRENTMRAGTAVSAIAAAKTHCPAGHPYDETNTYRSGGKRFCRTCAKTHNQAYKQRNRR